MESANSDRSRKVSFRLAPEEYEYIKRKAQTAGSKSVSGYVRKMAITGAIVKYPEDDITAIKRDIAGIASNINQIAMQVNTSKNVYREDINEVRDKVGKIWRSLTYIQSTLQSISQ